jgi:hypothetical protein
MRQATHRPRGRRKPGLVEPGTALGYRVDLDDAAITIGDGDVALEVDRCTRWALGSQQGGVFARQIEALLDQGPRVDLGDRALG